MRHEKSRRVNEDGGEIPRIDIDRFDKSCPLRALPVVRREGWRQGVGRRCRDWGPAASERRGYGARQAVIGKAEGPAENPDVMEVLHASVVAAERRDCLELLGDHGLSGIAAELRRRHAEQNGVVECLGFRLQRVAEADVYRDLESRTADFGCGDEAKTAIGEMLADALDLECGHVEDNAIVTVGRHYFTEDGKHVFPIGIAEAQQVEVARAAVGSI
jgi:hypothetical protein